MLEAVEVATGPNPSGTVLWLHGLGADGHDFEPIVPELVAPHERSLRFVFPHAPVRPVTINNGLSMRAWYDILGFDRRTTQDVAGIRASDAAVRALIERENSRGIPTSRIVLGGFSQGGALALYTGPRYPERLAGFMGLSCYMLLEDSFPSERSRNNYGTPVFLAHGTQDPVVDIRLGRETRQLLEAGGYPVAWHTYDMPHAVCNEELRAMADWLRQVL
jgi:phospholipase/carboxylesterase